MKSKKLFVSFLAVVLCFSVCFAGSSYTHKIIQGAAASVLYSGRMYIANVTLTNPTTSAFFYDLWTTTATPTNTTIASQFKIMKETYCVPAETTKTFELRLDNVYDLKVAISTITNCAPGYDGGTTHTAVIEYR